MFPGSDPFAWRNDVIRTRPNYPKKAMIAGKSSPLKEVAIMLLATPSTSTERAFSIMGILLINRRSRLNLPAVQSELIININGDYLRGMLL